MKGFRQHPLLKVVNLVLPIAVIITLSILIHETNRMMTEVRDEHATDFVGMIRTSITSRDNPNSVHTDHPDFCVVTMYILEYVNDISNIHVVVFREDLTLVFPTSKDEIPFDFYGEHAELGKMMHEYEYGHIREQIRTNQKDIYFAWITTFDHENRFLLIYTMNQYVINFMYLNIFSYIAIILVAVYAVKTNLIDYIIYMKILSKSNKSTIDNFHYRKYD